MREASGIREPARTRAGGLFRQLCRSGSAARSGQARGRSADREAGNTLVEIALSLPILMMVIMMILEFGLVFNQMISLTQAVTTGAQVLQSDRLSTSNDPCIDTFNAIKGAAPTLDPAKISLTITMNGGTPINQTSCPNQQTQLAQGGPVSVEATYSYSLSIINVTICSSGCKMDSGKVTEIEY